MSINRLVITAVVIENRPVRDKKWLAAQPNQPATVAELQALIGCFVRDNHRRPHRSLEHRATPATVYTNRPRPPPATAATTPTTGSLARRWRQVTTVIPKKGAGEPRDASATGGVRARV